MNKRRLNTRVVSLTSAREIAHTGSAWESEQESGSIPQTHTQLDHWMGMYNTPPPQPTQETQQEHDESLVPGRDVRPPHMLGWMTPNPPPPRRGRRRWDLSIYLCWDLSIYLFTRLIYIYKFRLVYLSIYVPDFISMLRLVYLSMYQTYLYLCWDLSNYLCTRLIS